MHRGIGEAGPPDQRAVGEDVEVAVGVEGQRSGEGHAARIRGARRAFSRAVRRALYPRTRCPPSQRTGRAARRPGPALLASILLVAALAAGHALLWQLVGDRLEEGFAAWAASRRAEGWEVAHGPPRRGGWPFAATLTLPELAPGRRRRPLPGRRGGLAGGGAGAAHLAPHGSTGWWWRCRDATTCASAERRCPSRADRLERRPAARAADAAAAARRSSAEARRAALRHARTAPSRSRAASLGIGAPPTGAEPATALRVSAADATLPPGLPGTARLGPAVERVGLDLLLTGPVPPGRDPARRAAAWRDGGGALEIRTLDARWGEVAASASATLTLDGALQPAGTGTLRLVGRGSAAGRRRRCRPAFPLRRRRGPRRVAGAEPCASGAAAARRKRNCRWCSETARSVSAGYRWRACRPGTGRRGLERRLRRRRRGAISLGKSRRAWLLSFPMQRLRHPSARITGPAA